MCGCVCIIVMIIRMMIGTTLTKKVHCKRDRRAPTQLDDNNICGCEEGGMVYIVCVHTLKIVYIAYIKVKSCVCVVRLYQNVIYIIVILYILH